MYIYYINNIFKKRRSEAAVGPRSPYAGSGIRDAGVASSWFVTLVSCRRGRVAFVVVRYAGVVSPASFSFPPSYSCFPPPALVSLLLVIFVSPLLLPFHLSSPSRFLPPRCHFPPPPLLISPLSSSASFPPSSLSFPPPRCRCLHPPPSCFCPPRRCF